MIDLQETRKKIDEVDKKLVELFEYRMKLAADVADYKRSVGKAIYDPVREEEKLKTLSSLAGTDFNKTAVNDLFTQIMSMSRRLQYTMLFENDSLGFTAVENIIPSKPARIAYFGEKGSYTEQAMLEYFDISDEGIPMGTFREVMQAIHTGLADYGVLPIENSSTGALSDIYDLLSEYNNYIIGEHVIKIEHNLWGITDSELSDITTVYSHKQGLMQCSQFLDQYPLLKKVDGGSTAGSAKRVLEDNDKSQAAIASKRAGEYYGLKLLKQNIQNNNNNSTRFIIISNKKIYEQKADRVSLCFALPHKSGSLYHMLSNFIYNNINMTRIESRPIPGKTFEYRFFVDIEGNLENASVKNAIHCIKEEAIEMKILGSFVTVKEIS